MAESRYNEQNPPPELVAEVRERLTAICSDWPRELFERVTARAAWLEFKYDRAMTDSYRALSVGGTDALEARSDRNEPRLSGR